ncbi:MAG: gamma-glutamyltransferase [Alphaproteobacteria bacterium]|nr:gamma-glutamyltransferase [Alphaproteobacteria bacterium]
MATSCSLGGQSDRGPAVAFVGGAATDEPRAALAARDVLAAGGSAVDAATAAYFALAVTMPGTATLGGSGVCLVYDARLTRVEAIDFAAPAAAGGSPVPMNARGFFVMQGRYGRQRWEQLVAPAEGLARFGAPVSRALARELAENAGTIAANPDLARVFRRNGAPLREGDTLVQSDLADTLGQLRSRGAKEFYEGSSAADFVAAARAAGARFGVEEFRGATPQFRAPIAVNVDGLRMSFAAPPANAGLYQAQLWQMLLPRWRGAARDEQPHLFAEATRRAQLETARWPSLDLSNFGTVGELSSAQRAAQLMADYRPGQRNGAAGDGGFTEDPATATIVVADKEGGAVACAVTAGGAFGAGRIARGVVLARASEPSGRGLPSLNAMIGVRAYGGGFSLSPRAESSQLVFVGAGSGRGAASTLVQAALTTVIDRRPLDEAFDRPRFGYFAGSDELQGEAEVGQRFASLAARGHRLAAPSAFGRINAIACAEGLIDEPTSCRVRADTRGHGLAVGGVR